MLVTTHRRESWGEPMQDAMGGLGDVARGTSGAGLPAAGAPQPGRARRGAAGARTMPTTSILTEPLAYAEFAHVMARCHLVVTDSGGVQEEAPSLGKPVLVLRDTTERPEGVEAGTVRLVGTDRDVVAGEVERLLADPAAYDEMARAVNPYGDGRAAGAASRRSGPSSTATALPDGVRAAADRAAPSRLRSEAS